MVAAIIILAVVVLFVGVLIALAIHDLEARQHDDAYAQRRQEREMIHLMEYILRDLRDQRRGRPETRSPAVPPPVPARVSAPDGVFDATRTTRIVAVEEAPAPAPTPEPGAITGVFTPGAPSRPDTEEK
jgi:hypothetical protein